MSKFQSQQAGQHWVHVPLLIAAPQQNAVSLVINYAPSFLMLFAPSPLGDWPRSVGSRRRKEKGNTRQTKKIKRRVKASESMRWPHHLFCWSLRRHGNGGVLTSDTFYLFNLTLPGGKRDPCGSGLNFYCDITVLEQNNIESK